ncbi:MAG: DMT family transporter [Verrucomicrobiales bacterium]|nr:DMT family transporter [Verrucomicrobiales bacterium]
MSARGAETRGLAALLAGAVLIGFAPIWVRWSDVGSASTAFWRLALALPVLGLWAAKERPGAASPPTRVLPWILGAGVCFALDLSAWHLSIRMTTVANATLLGNLAPIFVTLGAWVFFSERAGSGFLVGMAAALLGAALLTGARPGIDPARMRGDLLGVATAVFYGAYQLCVARLRRGLSTGRLLFGSSLASTPALALIAWIFHEKFLPETANGWWVLAGLSLTAHVLGQGLITYGFAHLPAGLSSLTLLVQPLVATLAGWWLFHETLGPFQIGGGILLLAGLGLARNAKTTVPARDQKPAAVTLVS